MIKAIRKFLMYSLNTLYSILHKEKIVVDSCIVMVAGKLVHNNWGDDLNYFILNHVTSKPIVNYHHTYLFNTSNYIVIGSVIEQYLNAYSIVWGAGVIFGEKQLNCRPQKILAVRGPKTRQYLLSQGIDCPEIYGDPALLLPYIYKSKVEKKYKVGIIPHHTELKLPIIRELEQSGYRIINMKKYEKWTDIIDQINECEYIFSSSLHGLIVSDAYKVPNQWVKFSVIYKENDFKFEDYYMSVGKESISPLKIEVAADLELKEGWSENRIDLLPLIEVCPFIELKSLVKSQLV
ncbi:MAG: polysaccharide pyruvyl transferase family protein [Paludibacteraceae bacterium]|nr:polysaccharide pyruvyl transferase family protein [Paludibacteraceae bacterium]